MGGSGGSKKGNLVLKSANSRKSIRWTAVTIALRLMTVGCSGGSKRGSGPEGADDLCFGWNLSHMSGI